ncbi:MAG: bifunctional hydroxymethylpyrimidine kinase/phosphomethylpyrimidine kinase [Gemmatimonadetes bacterium]|nr:bifunctional hydroxymethylpyrimidine kinase/phosphomethylpyrimidine kinase [Gemmatimonadota bacterium]MYC91309.1 bifunctional hydroxymethylpyrimidine kinase/phosphomethylpyrimidine kinase [Gemmatimonadota bacterium]
MDSQPAVPVALTIAGSDSGGGAGIQADLKTFHQWGVYGTSVLTAVTAQNTLGVQAVHAVPSRIVAAQIESVAGDIPPRGVKSGMLANAGIVRAVAAGLRRWRLGGYVLDPVMVATSGDSLLSCDAVASIRDELVPLAAVVTPNWPEAVMLTGVSEGSVDGMEAAARVLVEAGAGAALVKGGHLGGDEVVDLFWDGRVRRVFRGSRIETRHTHGTGCTLSAAIAAGLARGVPLGDAVAPAVAWVRSAIAGAPGLGAGNGPLDHFTEVAIEGSRVSSSDSSVRPATDA